MSEKEDKPKSTVCENFEPQAWRKTICKNCFQPPEKHITGGDSTTVAPGHDGKENKPPVVPEKPKSGAKQVIEDKGFNKKTGTSLANQIKDKPCTSLANSMKDKYEKLECDTRSVKEPPQVAPKSIKVKTGLSSITDKYEHIKGDQINSNKTIPPSFKTKTDSASGALGSTKSLPHKDDKSKEIVNKFKFGSVENNISKVEDKQQKFDLKSGLKSKFGSMENVASVGKSKEPIQIPIQRSKFGGSVDSLSNDKNKQYMSNDKTKHTPSQQSDLAKRTLLSKLDDFSNELKAGATSTIGSTVIHKQTDGKVDVISLPKKINTSKQKDNESLQNEMNELKMYRVGDKSGQINPQNGAVKFVPEVNNTKMVNTRSHDAIKDVSPVKSVSPDRKPGFKLDIGNNDETVDPTKLVRRNSGFKLNIGSSSESPEIKPGFKIEFNKGESPTKDLKRRNSGFKIEFDKSESPTKEPLRSSPEKKTGFKINFDKSESPTKEPQTDDRKGGFKMHIASSPSPTKDIHPTEDKSKFDLRGGLKKTEIKQTDLPKVTLIKSDGKQKFELPQLKSSKDKKESMNEQENGNLNRKIDIHDNTNVNVNDSSKSVSNITDMKQSFELPSLKSAKQKTNDNGNERVNSNKETVDTNKANGGDEKGKKETICDNVSLDVKESKYADSKLSDQAQISTDLEKNNMNANSRITSIQISHNEENDTTNKENLKNELLEAQKETDFQNAKTDAIKDNLTIQIPGALIAEELPVAKDLILSGEPTETGSTAATPSGIKDNETKIYSTFEKKKEPIKDKVLNNEHILSYKDDELQRKVSIPNDKISVIDGKLDKEGNGNKDTVKDRDHTPETEKSKPKHEAMFKDLQPSKDAHFILPSKSEMIEKKIDSKLKIGITQNEGKPSEEREKSKQEHDVNKTEGCKRKVESPFLKSNKASASDEKKTVQDLKKPKTFEVPKLKATKKTDEKQGNTTKPDPKLSKTVEIKEPTRKFEIPSLKSSKDEKDKKTETKLDVKPHEHKRKFEVPNLKTSKQDEKGKTPDKKIPSQEEKGKPFGKADLKSDDKKRLFEVPKLKSVKPEQPEKGKESLSLKKDEPKKKFELPSLKSSKGDDKYKTSDKTKPEESKNTTDKPNLWKSIKDVKKQDSVTADQTSKAPSSLDKRNSTKTFERPQLKSTKDTSSNEIKREETLSKVKGIADKKDMTTTSTSLEGEKSRTNKFQQLQTHLTKDGTPKETKAVVPDGKTQSLTDNKDKMDTFHIQHKGEQERKTLGIPVETTFSLDNLLASDIGSDRFEVISTDNEANFTDSGFTRANTGANDNDYLHVDTQVFTSSRNKPAGVIDHEQSNLATISASDLLIANRDSTNTVKSLEENSDKTHDGHTSPLSTSSLKSNEKEQEKSIKFDISYDGCEAAEDTNEISRLKRELLLMTDRCSSVEKENQSLRDNLSKKDIEQGQLKKENHEVDTEVKCLKGRVKSLEELSEKLESDNNNLKSSLHSQIEQNKANEETIRKEKKDNEEDKSDRDNKDKIMEDMIEVNEELKQEIAELKLEMDEMYDSFRDQEAEEFRELQKELEITAKNCRILQFKLRKLERHNDQVEHDRNEYEDRLRRLQDQFQDRDAVGHIHSLEDELRMSKDVSVRLHDELDLLEEKRGKMDEENRHLTELLEQSDRKQFRLELEVDKLRDKLIQLRQELNAAKSPNTEPRKLNCAEFLALHRDII